MTLLGGKYRLLKEIGVGAMGVVSSAVNTATGGQVAIKLILRSEPELRQRLIREAQACGAIRHKNVVQVYDVGMTDTGDPFLVMELLQGETLAALLARKRRLLPHEACAIARDVARALAAAHAVPIVHRDLKPANIFLHKEPWEDEPIVKVVDFGVSKNLQVSDGLRTVAGGAVGSPMYMSPEQARADRALDHRADLWSLGVVLYEMLTGERPFTGETVEVVHKIVSEPIPRVAKRLRKLDPDVDRIVAGCLTRDPDQRLGPAAEIAKQLEQHTLGAMREPLPSLMETGGYDASPGSAAGSDPAALSPGYQRAPLGPASPGVGSTDLRPPSSGAALASRSAGNSSSSSGSRAVAADAVDMQGSDSWNAAGEGDGATIPIDPKMLRPRAAGAAARSTGGASSSRGGASAPPSQPEAEWGVGGSGTVPMQAFTGIAPRSASSSPGAPPPLAVPPPPAAPPSAASSSARPPKAIHDTVRMDQSVGAVLLSAAPPPTVPMAAVGAQPPSKPRRDRPFLVAIAVTVVSALAAVMIWVLVPTRGHATAGPEPSATVTGTGQQQAPRGTPSTPPMTTSDALPPAVPTAEVPPVVVTAEPAPTPTRASAPQPTVTAPPGPPKGVMPKATATASAAPPPSATAPSRATATTPKICKNKFGLKVPCPK